MHLIFVVEKEVPIRTSIVHSRLVEAKITSCSRLFRRQTVGKSGCLARGVGGSSEMLLFNLSICSTLKVTGCGETLYMCACAQAHMRTQKRSGDSYSTVSALIP